MSCEQCDKMTQHGASLCADCYSNDFCSMCDHHRDLVGPLRPRLGNNCCNDCLTKFSTLARLKKEEVEMNTYSNTTVVENPAYLTDLVNGWWRYGDMYYFAIQNQIYAAADIPMDIDDFKRAITFDTIDAQLCGTIRGTTVIWD